MDVPGILTNSTDLCRVVYENLSGFDPKDPTSIKNNQVKTKIKPIIDPSEVIVGIPKEYHCRGISTEVHDTWIKVADTLENHGAKVVEVSLPHTASSIFVYSILNQCEVASNMARYDGLKYGYRANVFTSTEQLYAATRQSGFNSVVKNRILSGNYFLLNQNYQKYFLKALKVRRLISEDFNKLFHKKNVDFLLTPTTLTVAPSYKDFVKNNNRDQCAIQDFCTQPSNMAGIPALSLPIRLSNQGLPISLQVMGPMLSDLRLISFCKWIETFFKFYKHYEDYKY